MTTNNAGWLLFPGTAGFQPALAAPDPERRTAVGIRTDWKNLVEPPFQYGDTMDSFVIVTDSNAAQGLST